MPTAPPARLLIIAGAAVAAIAIALDLSARAPGQDASDAMSSPPRPAPREQPPAAAIAPAMPTMHAPAPQRVVDADPAPEQAHDEREQLLTAVRDQTPRYESWNDRGIRILDSLGSDSRDHESVTVTDVGCYMAGCVATLTFGSRAAYQRVIDDLATSPDYRDYRAWTGGKRLTAPELLAGGRVVIALLLNRPD